MALLYAFAYNILEGEGANRGLLRPWLRTTLGQVEGEVTPSDRAS